MQCSIFLKQQLFALITLSILKRISSLKYLSTFKHDFATKTKSIISVSVHFC